MNHNQNWRYKLFIDMYRSFGLDIEKLIYDKKKFQRMVDLTWIAIAVSIIGVIVAIIGEIYWS